MQIGNLPRDPLEDLLESETEHIDSLETQLELISRVSIYGYHQSQMEVRS